MRSLPLALILLVFAACASDPSAPGDTGRAQVDPDQTGTFVLKSLETGPPERLVRIDLLGSDVQTDSRTGRVWLDVAVANRSNLPVRPRLLVWLSNFTPEDVVVTNADILPPVNAPIDPGLYGFDYSETFGSDGVLMPGEISRAKPWEFLMNEVGGFSFAARAENFEVGGNLGGFVFWDENTNGQQDPNEAPAGFGVVRVEGPDNVVRESLVDPRGRWSVEVPAPGLYSALFIPPPTLFAPLAFTTPNPLEVVMVATGSDGIVPFDDAHFGIVNANPVITRSDLPPDAFDRDPFDFGEAEVRNGFLWMRLGFSGCGPDHPVGLVMVDDFKESEPVRATVVITHDDQGELCDGWFEVERSFHLEPLVQWYRAIYGEGQGTVILELLDAAGDLHEVEFTF